MTHIVETMPEHRCFLKHIELIYKYIEAYFSPKEVVLQCHNDLKNLFYYFIQDIFRFSYRIQLRICLSTQLISPISFSILVRTLSWLIAMFMLGSACSIVISISRIFRGEVWLIFDSGLTRNTTDNNQLCM